VGEQLAHKVPPDLFYSFSKRYTRSAQVTMLPSWTAHDANRDNELRKLRRTDKTCRIIEKTPAAARPEFLVFERRIVDGSAS
jgi:hypothetical protein